MNPHDAGSPEDSTQKPHLTRHARDAERQTEKLPLLRIVHDAAFVLLTQLFLTSQYGTVPFSTPHPMMTTEWPLPPFFAPQV